MGVFNYDQVITHSTVFHADDVFGVALCRLLNPEIEIIRTLEVEKHLEMARNIGKNPIVFDIGLGKYDHHQPDKALRPDGTPYCGFGLLWRDFGRSLCVDDDAWNKVDQELVYLIDKADNGISQNLLSVSIKVMNPEWDSVESENIAFHRAMHVAIAVLNSHIKHANSISSAKDRIIRYYDGSKILILDTYLPWTHTVLSDDRFKNVLFVIYPSKRGNWNVQTVPKEPGTFANRMDFPNEWLGHADASRGITFAHTANFLIACDTKEQAIQVAKDAICEGNKPYKAAFSV